jgi:hypothetical protein
MTKRYTGGVVSSSLPTVNAAGASGVFNLSQQADAQSKNAWPPFKVEKSLRFRASNSAYLSRTPAVAGNQKTWTWSAWVKRGSLGANRTLLHAYDGSASRRAQFLFNTSDQFEVNQGGSSSSAIGTSTAVFRDPSAWYHIVLSANYGSSAFTFYVNGVSQAMTYSTSVNNENGQINGAWAHQIGSQTTSNLFDGYVSEVNFVDGLALTPSSFGATDKDGNWSPIAYTGTYGQNGFYVNFRDNTSATTMGYDYSGNGNNWTLSGFNVSTANTTYDIMFDVPEDQSDGTANNRGNYCTFNPLDKDSNITTSNGNLAASTSTVDHNLIRSTIAIPSSGKFYAEMSFDQTMSGNPAAAFALISPSASLSAHIVSAGNYSVYGSAATVLSSGATSGASVTGMTSGQTWQIAVDADNNQAWVGLNNAWYNVYTSGATTGNPSTNTNPTFTGTMAGLFFGADFVNASGSINFGQRPFTYAPPSGFKSLNTFNLPEPTIKQPNKHFDATIWSGDNASPRAITNSGLMQPDWVWVKRRNGSAEHTLFDAVRGFGGNKELSSNTTGVEGALNTSLYGFVSATNSTGFQLTAGSTDSSYTNRTGDTYVGWQWNAGNANTTNTSGSVTSIVRANPTAGFSIVTYTATAADPITVGHGLGVAPSMFMVKSRSASGTDWFVYHSSLGATKNLRLNTTAAAATATNVWNDTAPTSSVITTSNAINTNGVTYVAYCFASVAGYSAFGSYTGNGSTDGPFVYTGFRPKWILMKSTTETGLQWSLWDSSRIGYNPSNYFLAPQSSAAEDTTNSGSNSNGGPDFLSNGFKMRSNGGSHNSSGATYIYMAFAEAPFKYSRSR